VLTPQEFIEAGDQLAFKFPTWNWQAADPLHQVSWLPPNKQYLITRSVTCRRRVRDLDKSLGHNTSEDEGWTLHQMDATDGTDDIADVNLDRSPVRHLGFNTTDNFVSADRADEGLDDVPCSLDSLMCSAEDDPAVVATAPSSDYFVSSAPGADIVQTRTYDLTITYDKYYQTPRLWLFGYDENGIPLTTDQIFEDMLTQYAKTTVTVDPHPCTGIPTASIHPCKHAEMMKKVVDSWVAKGVIPRHDLTLFVLLKFISSVVPTIDYDFTTDVHMI